jgi:hypothetical protein
MFNMEPEEVAKDVAEAASWAQAGLTVTTKALEQNFEPDFDGTVPATAERCGPRPDTSSTEQILSPSGGTAAVKL